MAVLGYLRPALTLRALMGIGLRPIRATRVSKWQRGVGACYPGLLVMILSVLAGSREQKPIRSGAFMNPCQKIITFQKMRALQIRKYRRSTIVDGV